MFETNNEIGDTLQTENNPKRNGRIFIIIGVSIIVVVAIIVLVVLLTKSKKDNSDNQETQEIKTKLSTIPLPEGVIIDDGHYLFDGNIFICYKRNSTNYTYFGVISDDGSNFKELYGAEFIV